MHWGIVVYWFLWTVHWQRHWSLYQQCGECSEAAVRRRIGIAVRHLMKPVQQEEEMEEMDVRDLEKDDILESSSWEGECPVPCSVRSVPTAAFHWITDHGPFQRAGQLQSCSLWNICRWKSWDNGEGDCPRECHLLLWRKAHECRIRTERSLSMPPLTTAH